MKYKAFQSTSCKFKNSAPQAVYISKGNGSKVRSYGDVALQFLQITKFRFQDLRFMGLCITSLVNLPDFSFESCIIFKTLHHRPCKFTRLCPQSIYSFAYVTPQTLIIIRLVFERTCKFWRRVTTSRVNYKALHLRQCNFMHMMHIIQCGDYTICLVALSAIQGSANFMYCVFPFTVLEKC